MRIRITRGLFAANEQNVTVGAVPVSRVVVGLLLILGVAGCSAPPIAGVPSASLQVVADMRAESDATRSVCVDFEARGGALYQVLVVPMLTSGPPGYKSLTVDVAQMARATQSITEMETSDLAKVPAALRDPAERMVASAKALGLYDHTEGTALLTAFTEVAVECTKAQHKPSWFEPEKLVGR